MKTLAWLVVVLLLTAGALGSRGSLAAVDTQISQLDALVEQLADPSAEERSEAREGLLLLGEVAVPPLLVTTKSDSALLRWEAVNLLGALGDLRATDAVLAVAMTDTDVHARWRANWAIANLDDGTVIPRLVAALDSEDRTLVWNCAVTLSLFSVAEAVLTLHGGLDSTGWQQWEAVNALGRVWNGETASLLVSVLQSASEDVRKEAALSLGRIGGEEALAALLAALADDCAYEVRWRAAMMIGFIGDQTAAAQLATIRAQEVHPFVIEHIDDAIQALTDLP